MLTRPLSGVRHSRDQQPISAISTPSSEFSFQHGANALRSASIAVRIDRPRHSCVLAFIVEQALDFTHDDICLHPDKASRSGADRLWALCHFAHDQDRFSKSRPLFLDTARICHENARAAHQIYERLIVEGFNQEHPVYARKLAVDDVADIGIGMDRKDNLNVFACGQPLDSSADMQKAVAKCLSAMRCQHHNATLTIEIVEHLVE